MIHGAGGGGWEFELWRPVFERSGLKVLAPDLMPTGDGLAATTFSDYVQQIEEVALGEYDRLILVGASLGGIIALKVAESLRPCAIILINSVPSEGIDASWVGKSYPAIVRWANGPLKLTYEALPDGDESTILWVHARWRDESGAVLNAVARGIHVPKPACPTLVVLGEEDTDVPVATGLAIARWIGADVHVYAATSHVGPLLGRRATEIADAALLWTNSSLHGPLQGPNNAVG